MFLLCACVHVCVCVCVCTYVFACMHIQISAAMYQQAHTVTQQSHRRSPHTPELIAILTRAMTDSSGEYERLESRHSAAGHDH